MWIHKIRNNFSNYLRFQITFLQLNTKKILLYVIGQDFHHYFLQLEFSIARSTRERYHVTNIGHACNKQQQTLKTQSETRVRT